MKKVEGRVAIVTGGSQGMGEAHAALLAEHGAQVIVCDIADDAGRAVAARIGGHFQHLDVAAEDDWKRVVEHVTTNIGPITILINNAGIAGLNRVQDTPTEEWNKILAINLNGTFFGIREVTPSMRGAGGGVIVNVSSDAALTGMPHIAAYATSKWAVRGLTRSAALDLAGDNIRVVSLHPGIVRTPMGDGVDMDAIGRSQPMGRVGEASELAKMMLFIVADATYSTGCEFIADGGHTTGVHLPI